MQGKSGDERLASQGRIRGTPSNPSGELIGHQDRKGKLNPSKPQNALGSLKTIGSAYRRASLSGSARCVCTSRSTRDWVEWPSGKGNRRGLTLINCYPQHPKDAYADSLSTSVHSTYHILTLLGIPCPYYAVAIVYQI